MKKILLICSLLTAGYSCKQPTQRVVAEEKVTDVSVPEFNSDSAWQYTAAQVAFGPRVPNTPAHEACGNYLTGTLKSFGAQVIEQEALLQTYDKKTLHAKNIIASFHPENPQRILLCAHWDSRPFADYDPDPANHRKAISGANDGAGACGALLEIARQIGIASPAIGVDIILFDAEDWGTPSFDQQKYGSKGWCLGSEYWAQNPHVRNYKAQYGILLDMVSAPGAQFYKEYFSMQYAGKIVNKVWDTARALGYHDYFIDQRGSGVTDDHLEVFKYRKIPCIDIIQYDPHSDTGFGAYWHTLDDTMENVSRETLKAVGQTVLYVVYHEK
ncbi:MAG: M28 family peptidase [Dysgonamonadaceae bacterium]|jgi:Zn-dependent M28 family amino/carboxypeptidase|nr:M28 family peptidase [Dysgonamonadaceae bacterium]